MADEMLKRDDNYVPVMGGVTDDAALDVAQIRLDPLTKRLSLGASSSEIGTIIKITDHLQNYKISNIDESGNPTYYGKTDKDGNWIIVAYNTTTGSIMYQNDSSGYVASWANRATLNYDYFYNIF